MEKKNVDPTKELEGIDKALAKAHHFLQHPDAEPGFPGWWKWDPKPVLARIELYERLRHQLIAQHPLLKNHFAEKLARHGVHVSNSPDEEPTPSAAPQLVEVELAELFCQTVRGFRGGAYSYGMMLELFNYHLNHPDWNVKANVDAELFISLLLALPLSTTDKILESLRDLLFQSGIHPHNIVRVPVGPVTQYTPWSNRDLWINPDTGTKFTNGGNRETFGESPPAKKRRLGLGFDGADDDEDSFYNTNQPANPSPRPLPNLPKLFDKYRGTDPLHAFLYIKLSTSRAFTDDPKNNPDTIGVEGAMSYLADVKVNLDEVAMLAVFELLQSPTQGEITREGFCNGWKDLQCDTILKQADYIKSTLRTNLPIDPTFFRKTYRYTFTLARASPAQKSLPLDVATEYWRLLFSPDNGGFQWSDRDTPWLEWWMEFLETRWKKGVNRDMWDQLGVFVMKTLEDEELGFWSEDGAWPGAIDEFVLFVREKRRVDDGVEEGGEAMEE